MLEMSVPLYITSLAFLKYKLDDYSVDYKLFNCVIMDGDQLELN